MPLTRSHKLPAHLTSFLRGDWAIWRDFALRAPGFCVDGLDDFGPQENELLRKRACDPRFREAVIWQNPSAARTAIYKIAETSADRSDSKTRRRREVVASYWQRYCARNETIGFFGPLGWGQFSSDGPAVMVSPGKELIASRHVRFEVWAIQALADAIAKHPAIRPSVPPSRRPDLLPNALPLDQMKTWRLCDGVRPAGAVGHAGILQALEKNGYVRVTFPIAVCGEPERELRLQLSTLEPEHVRLLALAALDRLEDARREVSGARDAMELERALEKLDQVFVGLTQTDPTRLAGQHYAGRTLAYLDCRRDIQIRIGPALRATLAETLSPLLSGSRWFCGEVATTCRHLVEEAHTELQGRLQTNVVPLSALLATILPRFKQVPPELREPNRRLQVKWSVILNNREATGFVQRAATVFADPSPAWRGAVWQAPDVQISARSVVDINDGNYQVVVADFHPTNTLLQGLFISLNPAPDSLIAAADRDVPPPRLALAPDRSQPRVSGRFAPANYGPKDLLVLADPNAAIPNGIRGVASTDLFIAAFPDGPILKTRNGEAVGLLHELLGSLYCWIALMTYDPFPACAYSPRLTVGRCVYRRESWNLVASDCLWAFETESSRRFHVFAQWWSALAMPRRLFVLAPGEVKPLYLDAHSAVLVDVAARAIRTSASSAQSRDAIVRFSEMLPGPEQCWLTDADGGRYTSELRMIAVDLNSTATASSEAIID